MTFIKKLYANILILLIFAAGLYFRATWYGDLRLSIANAETHSYISSSKNPLFSWEIFAGQRLFTTNLIYKLANDEANCPITSFGKPAIGEEVEREIQPCFDKITLLQNFISMFAWCFLGWMLARQLKHPLIKVAAASIVMLFGFTPQVAEWDSALSPESLSLSMFILSLGLALELVLRAARSEAPLKSRAEKWLLAGFLPVFLLWVFIRDPHLFALPPLLVLLVPILLIGKFRKSKGLYIAIGVLLIFFVIGFRATEDSQRGTNFTQGTLMNSFNTYIFPYPARVEFFERFGMPDKDSPEFTDWAHANAPRTYGLFLISHPGFIASTLWENMNLLTSDFTQPYFVTDKIKHRDALLIIGEMVNPETGAVYLVSVLLLLNLFFQAVGRRTPDTSAWAWLAIWAFGTAAATLLISYFGDTAGLRRHIMPSIEMIRIFFWAFLMPFLDQSLIKDNEQ